MKVAKQFRVTPEQNETLQKLAVKLGVSQSEVVRRIIESLPEPDEAKLAK